MTNARQIKGIFAPLMKRNESLVALSGGFIWLTPVRHVACRVLIERSSDPDTCWPQWALLHTFIPGWDLSIGIGERGHLKRPASSQERFWRWSDPSMIDDAVSVIETEALPLLRAMGELDAFAGLFEAGDYRRRHEWPVDRMIFEIALGNLDAARAIWHGLAPDHRENRYPESESFQQTRGKILAVAGPLLAGDRAALARILHGWEEANMRGTRIEPHWEPTPFPLEAAPG